MLIPMKDMTGKQVGEIELSDSIFAAPVNTSLMHQALVRQLANARKGTHSTKTRGEVRGGGRKPWRQKGTGRARHGSIRSPIWVGGGTVFGPRVRKYTKRMPKKMRRAALRSALTVKANAGQLVVVDQLMMETPKTKAMIELLNALGIDGQSVLLVLPEQATAVQRSARNLPHVKTLLANYLNLHDLLGCDTVVLSQESIMHIEDWLALDNGFAPLPADEDWAETAANGETIDDDDSGHFVESSAVAANEDDTVAASLDADSESQSIHDEDSADADATTEMDANADDATEEK